MRVQHQGLKSPKRTNSEPGVEDFPGWRFSVFKGHSHLKGRSVLQTIQRGAIAVAVHSFSRELKMVFWPGSI
jgi:hypothetical protein